MKPRHTRFTQTIIFLFLFLVFYAQGKLETGSACLIENINGYEVDPCPRLHYCEQGHCVHKGLSDPHILEIICYFLVFILSGIACASGVGASYTLAPIIVMLAAYSSNAAIRIVYCLIFGGMIAAFTIKCRKRDPDTKTPLIQYDLCLICLPIMVLGATYGVFLNITLPPLVIAVCLITTMAVSLIRIHKKIKLLRAQEQKKEVQIPRNLNEMNTISNDPLEAESSEDKNIQEPIERKLPTMTEKKNYKGQYARFSDEIVDKNIDFTSNITKYSKMSVEISQQEEQSSQELSNIYKSERRLFPIERFIECVLLLAAMVLLALMRGTSSLESILGVEYCSEEYWFLLVAVIPCMLMFHWRGCSVALKSDERRVKANYSFENRFRLDKKMLNTIRILCFIAGFLSGAAGVGVGVIIIPYLIGKGMKSPSASATSGFFNIFTAFTSMLLAVLGKDLKVEEMIFYCLIGFVGSGCSCLLVAKLNAKLKINYLEVLMVWFIVLVGLFVSPGLLIYIGVDNPSGLVKFKSLC